MVREDGARVIRLLFTLLLDGQRSLWQITQELIARATQRHGGAGGVPSTVKRLVQSDVYIGRIFWDKQRPQSEWILIPVPTIVQPVAGGGRQRPERRQH